MKYTATISREDGSWLADIEELPGAHTFARSLARLTTSIREVVILMADLPDDAEIDIDFHFITDDDAVAAAEDLRRQRVALAQAESDLVAETGRLAAVLSRNYSVRDTAVMLGITAGRVSQLT